MAIDLATLGLEVDSRPVIRARDELGRFTRSAQNAEEGSTRVTRATDLMGAAFKRMAALYGAYQIGAHAKDAAMLAARYETMGVVMRVAGNNAGYTNTQMQAYQKTLQATGISMIQSRAALTSLSSANIDLAKSTDLARTAQNLAVVANLNSSEALASMIQGIKSAETEVLQTLGLNVKFEAGYAAMARQLGKTTNSLSENEKMMARTNQVLKEGAAYAGIYEGSMTTAGKQISSLSRYIEDLKTKAGEIFLPALSQSVIDFTNALKESNKELDRQGGSGGNLERWGTAAAKAYVIVTRGAISAAEQVSTMALTTYDRLAGIAKASAALATGGGFSGWQKAMQDAADSSRRATDQSEAFRAGLYKDSRAVKQTAEEIAAASAKKEAAEKKLEEARIKAGEEKRKEAAEAEKRIAAEEEAAKAAKAAGEEYKKLLENIHEKIAADKLAVATGGQLTQGQEYAAEILGRLRDGTLKLSAAETTRLKAQLEAMTLAEKARIEMEARNEAIKAQTVLEVEALQALMQKNEDLRTEIANYGLSTRAINENTIAVLERKIALEDMDAREITAAQSKIQLLRQQNELLNQLSTKEIETDRAEEQKKLYEDQMKARVTATEKAQDGIDRIFREGFSAMLRTGSGSFKSWTESLKNTFKTSLADELYKMFAKPFVVQMVGQMQGFLGMGSGSAAGGSDTLSAAGNAIGGSTGSALNMVSTAKNLYSAFSSGSMPTLATMAGKGVSYLGSAMGNNSIFSYGQGLQGFSAGGVGSGIAPGASSAGAGAIGAVNIAGGIAGGIYGGRALSNGYGVGGSGNGTVNTGTAIGAAVGSIIPVLGTALGALIGGLVGGAVNRLFGHKAKEVTGTGLQGSYGVDGASGQSYSEWMQKGGLFRSDKKGTDREAFDAETIKQFNEGFDTLKKSATGYATSLGVTGDQLADYTKTFNIKLGKDAAENEKILTEFFSGVGDEMAMKLVPGLKEFAKYGETAGQTMERLAGLFQATNGIAKTLGQSGEKMFGGLGVATTAVRERFVEMSGGLEALSASASAYATNFMSEAERLAPVQKAVADALADLGYSSVKTREQFKATVDGLISSGAATTAEGAKRLASVLALSEAFALVTPAIEATSATLRTATEIAEERKQLQEELNELTMTETQLRAEERNAIDQTNQALFDSVTAAQAARAANEEAKTLQDELNTLTLTATELRAKERAAIHESNRALFDSITAAQAAQGAVQTLLTAAQASVDSALGSLSKALDARKDVIREEYDIAVEAARQRTEAAKEAAQAQLTVAKDMVTGLKSLYSKLADTAKEISGLSVGAAQGVLEAAAAAAKQGKSLNGFKDLEDALEVLGKNTTDAYVSMEDYLREQAKSGRLVAELTGATEGQLDTAERQVKATEDAIKAIERASDLQLKALEQKRDDDLKAADKVMEDARAGLDLLNGIQTATLSVAEAVALVNKTLAELAAAQKANGAAPSASGDALTKSIQHLYTQLLGRTADAGGLDYFSNVVKSGQGTLGDVANSIATSNEYKAKVGDPSADRLEALYTSVLGRASDDKGKTFWASAMKSGVSLEQIEREFKESQEYKALKGYAGGGMKSAGVAMVGEVGPEVITSGEGKVWSHSQMKSAFGGDDTAALLAVTREQLAESRKQTAVLESHLFAIAKSVLTTADYHDKADAIGTPPVRQEETQT